MEKLFNNFSGLFSSNNNNSKEIQNILISESTKMNEISDIKTNTYDVTKLFLAYPRTKNLAIKDDTNVNKCYYQCLEYSTKFFYIYL